jgi:uncharacterized protein YkwD
MLSLNWLDYLILIVLALYGWNGYSDGFIKALLNLGNFIVSFLAGLKFYGFIAGILVQRFSISTGFANAIGFFALAFLIQIILGVIIRKFLFFRLPALEMFNKILGIFPGILSGAVFISFILVLVVAFPVSTPIKKTVSSSKVGAFLLSNTQGWEKQLNGIFGGAINETINFLTVEPKSNEIVPLKFKTNSLIDPSAEKEMFIAVNNERLARGLRELVFDDFLRDVGRDHCQDMFTRGYFSHYTPDGFSPFDRMDRARIVYSSAGENLALSPNVNIAMQGLMNSPGHKANILSNSFGKIGVGVMDGGLYGEMFCQEFTN